MNLYDPGATTLNKALLIKKDQMDFQPRRWWEKRSGAVSCLMVLQTLANMTSLNWN